MTTERIDKFRIVRRSGKRDYPRTGHYADLATAEKKCDSLNDRAEAGGMGRPYRVQGGSRR